MITHQHQEVVPFPKNLIMGDVAGELDGTSVDTLGQLPEEDKLPSESGKRMFRVAVESFGDTGKLYQGTKEKLESLPGEFITNVTAGEGAFTFRNGTSIPEDELVFDQPLGVGANIKGAQGLVGVYRKKA